jgi:hypothetical protein
VGATVSVPERKSGTLTDFNGAFVIEAQSLPTVLKVSFIGYREQQVDVYDNSEPVTIELSEAVDLLDEVVVVGYTQTKRSSRTGAISSIASKDFAATAAAGFDEKIQGQAPGLIISGSQGTPGSAVFVRLRGTTSINAGNEPL